MAADSFGVQVVTTERALLSGAATSVVLRTSTGWLRKRSILRARLTVRRSSSESSSMPRMAMMSCSSL